MHCSLMTTTLDDKLSLYQHNSTLYTEMEESELNAELHTWKALNLARAVAVVLGWFIVSLRPSTDSLYKNLRRLNSEKMRNNKIETVLTA